VGVQACAAGSGEAAQVQWHVRCPQGPGCVQSLRGAAGPVPGPGVSTPGPRGRLQGQGPAGCGLSHRWAARGGRPPSAPPECGQGPCHCRHRWHSGQTAHTDVPSIVLNRAPGKARVEQHLGCTSGPARALHAHSTLHAPLVLEGGRLSPCGTWSVHSRPPPAPPGSTSGARLRKVRQGLRDAHSGWMVTNWGHARNWKCIRIGPLKRY
jgi:hypothetical protein